MSTRREQMLELRLEGATYKAIAAIYGVTHQRVQQLLSPPKPIREYVVSKAKGRCEHCELVIGKSGHVHHQGARLLQADTYHEPENLILLCNSCHRRAHSAPPRVRVIVERAPLPPKPAPEPRAIRSCVVCQHTWMQRGKSEPPIRCPNKQCQTRNWWA